MGSALKNIGKAIAPVAASFIPGVGPFIAPMIGAALSAGGGSGKQKGTTSNQQQQNTGTTAQQQATTNLQQGQTQQTGFQNVLEDPEFAAFRESLLPAFGQQIANLNKPIFGDAQKAAFMGNLNDLAAASSENLKQGLARSGALDSGRLGQGLTDIELGRSGQAASFLSQLPFLEQQAQQQRAQGILGLASGFAGRAPLSQVYGSAGTTAQQQAGTVNTTGQTAGQTTSTGEVEEEGPSFLKNLMSNLGGVFAEQAGAAMDDKLYTKNAAKNLPKTVGFTPYGYINPNKKLGGVVLPQF